VIKPTDCDRGLIYYSCRRFRLVNLN